MGNTGEDANLSLRRFGQVVSHVLHTCESPEAVSPVSAGGCWPGDVELPLDGEL